jgi:hypothetical protein
MAVVMSAVVWDLMRSVGLHDVVVTAEMGRETPDKEVLECVRFD